MKDCDKEIKQLERHKKQLSKALEQLGINPEQPSNMRTVKPRQQRMRARRDQAVLWLQTVQANSDANVEFTAHDYLADVGPDDSSLTIGAAQAILWKLSNEGVIDRTGGKYKGYYKFKDALYEVSHNVT